MKEQLSLRKAQEAQASWEDQCMIDRSPQTQVLKKLEEDGELRDAVRELSINNTEEAREAVAKEAIDVIIVTLGIIDAVGFDAEQVFKEKMDRNYRKYNPDKIRELVFNHGLEPQEAIAQCKEDWELNL
jgi:NTP pyrophosphatase (non-canonical NTP hydrolase)